MRKIKRFVLNDSMTVLSAQQQREIKGGATSDYWDGCNTNSNVCNVGWACLASNTYTVMDGFMHTSTFGETWYGHCVFDESANACKCQEQS